MFDKLKNEDLNRKNIDDFKKSKKNPLIFILDNIRSLHNVGSVFRNSDAFLVEKIYLCGITGVPPHKSINKAALGSTDSVDWEYFESSYKLILKLRENGFKIFAVEQTLNSTNLIDFYVEKGFKYVFVFGNEIKGISQEILNIVDGVIEIPQFGTKHSLNISICSGIISWDFYTKYKGE